MSGADSYYFNYPQNQFTFTSAYLRQKAYADQGCACPLNILPGSRYGPLYGSGGAYFGACPSNLPYQCYAGGGCPGAYSGQAYPGYGAGCACGGY